MPIPGDSRGQATQGSEQPDLPVVVPVRCRAVGLDGLQVSLPTETILRKKWFVLLPVANTQDQ